MRSDGKFKALRFEYATFLAAFVGLLCTGASVYRRANRHFVLAVNVFPEEHVAPPDHLSKRQVEGGAGSSSP